MIELLKKIVESSSSELSAIDTPSNEFLSHFKNARRSYFLNDIDGLYLSYNYFEAENLQLKYSLLCREIIKIRILIREKNKEINDFKDLSFSDNFINKNLDLIEKTLLVELLAVEAILSDLNGNADLSYQKNISASQLANELGMKKKSCTLKYNAIVALNHKSSSSLRICNLVDTIQMAKDCEDHNTEIAALSSLAHEYEQLGCIELAHEEAIKAIELAKKHCFGSFNFCSVLLIGIKLSIQAKNINLANEHLKLVETFNFEELKDKITELKQMINSSEPQNSLSGDEQKIIQLLTASPKDKQFLIHSLYGNGDSESLDNRLKQLLLRLRKKRKNLISYNKKNCVYSLNY